MSHLPSPNSKITIYVTGHKNFRMIPSEDVFFAIHTGRKGSKETFCALGDDTGDNISEKNDSFCELTALYWIWKNTPCSVKADDYVGFFHYRRHLNFSDTLYKENKWGVSEYENLSEEYLEKNALNDDAVKAAVLDYDIILPKKWNVQDGKTKWSSIERHYALASHHFIKDYDEAIAILKEKYPDYRSYADSFNEGSEAYWCNMFIMRRAILNKYCSWLFDILFELEKRLDLSHYNMQEKRVFGYISERLFNIFLAKLLADEPELKVKTLQRTFIENTNSLPNISPFYKTNNIGIVMAFNDSFSAPASATIYSIAKSSSPENNYDIVILENTISAANKEKLQETISEYHNFNIRYVDISALPIPAKVFIHSHFSRDVYSRLFIPSIFSKYEKIVYIDADMIVLKDIAELYNTNIQGKALGVVRDCVMDGFRAFKTKSSPYALEAAAYLRTILHLTNPEDYFQSGIILFSTLSALKQQEAIRAIILGGTKYWFPDQDILNKIYHKDIFFIDPRWNVFNGNGDTDTFFSKLPETSKFAYFESRKDPYIIHFAGPNKPWLTDKGDFHAIFWKFARNTPFYESLLKNFLSDERAMGSGMNLCLRNGHKETDKYSLFGLPIWQIKYTRSGKRYGIGPFRVAKTKHGRNNTYLYIFGIKCATLRRYK